MNLLSLIRIEKSARRLTEVIGVLGKYGLADWIGRIPYEWVQNRLVSPDGQHIKDLPPEARLRLALTELGTTYIKLGQMLSTRTDVLTSAQAAELAELQANTPPDPPDVVRRVIEAELGQPVESLFRKLETEAFASASIGQVHRAWLPDGRPVVLKVQHEAIEEPVLRDLDLMAGLAEVVQQHVAAARNYQPVAMVREFRRTLLRELDFNYERRNLEEFARLFRGHEGIRFPSVFPKLCSRRVLTMEGLEGIPGTDLAAMQDSGADLSELARRAGEMYLEMIFRDGFYHADPHPGNFLLMPGGVLGVLDCGMVGRLDEQFREEFEDFLLAVVQKDAQLLASSVLRLAAPPPGLDRDALRTDLGEFLGEFSSQSLEEFDLAGALERFVSIVRRYHLVLPAPATLILKTLVELEGTARRLSADFSLAELIARYQTKAIGRRFLPARWLRKLQHAYRDWERLVSVLPGDLAEILDRVRVGTFEVHHVHTGLEKTVNRMVLGILSAALFLSSSLLLSRGGAGGLGHTLTVLGGLGLGTAIWLGFRVVRDIGRSKDRDRDT